MDFIMLTESALGCETRTAHGTRGTVCSPLMGMSSIQSSVWCFGRHSFRKISLCWAESLQFKLYCKSLQFKLCCNCRIQSVDTGRHSLCDQDGESPDSGPTGVYTNTRSKCWNCGNDLRECLELPWMLWPCDLYASVPVTCLFAISKIFHCF